MGAEKPQRASGSAAFATAAADANAKKANAPAGSKPEREADAGRSSPPPRWHRQVRLVLPPLLHLLSLLLYVYPLTRSHPYNPDLLGHPRPVLDEAHIMSEENKDVRGTAPWTEVWKNDYWGRPMSGASSHKSWRPLTVLSFRWGKLGGLGWGELFSHRLVNVLIHSTVAELASILSVKLFTGLSPSGELVTRTFVKLLFMLHPTHVECTANAANRPHILSLMFAALASDPDGQFLVLILAVGAGLLCSETMVFQLPAVLVTMTAIRWKGLCQSPRSGRARSVSSSSWKKMGPAAVSLLPRYFVVIALGLTYLVGRYMYDTLSIPDGLIRPAENPYYSLVGIERAATYSLVLSSHVGKAFLVDPVGFSHEYGFDCVRKVMSLSPLQDARLGIPIGLLLLAVVVTCECILAGVEACVLWLVMLSWLATLFPVSGFVKVGTSIADRIAVPSTLAVAVFGGRALGWFVTEFGARWFKGGAPASSSTERQREKASNPLREWTFVKSALVAALYIALWARVDRRASEWMDSVPLLESSLESCPRSAKSNLEISKIYSGLYPDKFDLDKAISHLETAEEIDPTYCDIHQQFAHCHIQQGRYLEFEERLTNSVMCPFSMGGAVPMWQQYWKAVTADPKTGEAARGRMDKYQKIINEAVQREVKKEEEEKRRQKEQGKKMDSEL